ncbi:extracellular triacylglycerol lipase precursor [Daedaleopsis nitida]|nr:extracellular triacylglycerol lipase precursor [Daedaleopsis nitida]
MGTLALTAALLFSCYQVVTAATQLPQVNLGSTTLVGKSQKSTLGVDVDFFGGIPYAEPPLGDLRFAPPVLKDTLPAGSFDAASYGPPCIQYSVDGVSEDCLMLNVFRPSGVKDTAGLPVMVWIFGGGFIKGSPSDPKFNATRIIGQSVHRGTPVVYVSINYRVGPFGYPQGTEAEKNGALNLAHKDQLTGLKWVQQHIKAFGGDPTKVTIFGQSAGAVQISDLFLNSGLEKYVRGAILQSSSASTFPALKASVRDVVWNNFVSKVPACAKLSRGNTFSCMRSADTAALLTAWQEIAASYQQPLRLFGPTIDGPGGIIPDLPSKLIAAGKYSKIPFIAGTVQDEGTHFTSTSLSSDEQIIEFLTDFDQPFMNATQAFKDDLQTLLELYPDNPALGCPFGTGNETFGFSSQYKRSAAIIGDAAIHSTRRAWIQAASAAGVKTFGYIFTDQNAVTEPSEGVTHSKDVPYMYGTMAETSDNAGVRLLSEAMVDYWISFATSLTPNDGKGLQKETWPQYKPDNQVLIQLDTTKFASASPSVANFTVINDDYRAKQIAFLNSVSADLNM